MITSIVSLYSYKQFRSNYNTTKQVLMWMLKSWEEDLEEADVMLGRQLAGQRWGGEGGRGEVPSNFSWNLASLS